MQALDALMPPLPVHAGLLKRYALLFDKLYLWNFDPTTPLTNSEDTIAELTFLREANFLIDAKVNLNFTIGAHVAEAELQRTAQFFSPMIRDPQNEFGRVLAKHYPSQPYTTADENHRNHLLWLDFVSRTLVDANPTLSASVPICSSPLDTAFIPDSVPCRSEDVLRVAINNFPIPDESSSWADIFEFKQEMHDQQWHFRRWLRSMTNAPRTEGEVRDELEWCLNEYGKAMRICKIKARHSFVEAYLIPALEVFEDLLKFNWSKIVKGAISVQKRKVDLLEAEMKAPGRECAYVFQAGERFDE